MSSSVFSKPNPSSVQTRRNPTMNDQIDNNSQRNTNRSLSGKFRSLFRKTSSSPQRSTGTGARPTTAPTRQRSSSPPATEEPLLRPPMISWPFGKKKSSSTSTGGKTKDKRKSKNKTPTRVEISNPIYQTEYSTTIHGQTFVPRTPELPHGATRRTPSTSSYEATTKGFRDYTVIDPSKASQQVITTDTDIVIPPPYSSDHSRSPSINRHSLHDSSVEYLYRQNPARPDIHNSSTASHSVLTATQILAEHTPTLPPSTTSTTNLNHWKGASSSSLNHVDSHRRSSESSDESDVPKLNPPVISFGSTSERKEPKRTDVSSSFDQTYHSLSKLPNNHQQPTYTYGSFPDVEILQDEHYIPLQPNQSTTLKYPGLLAILEHHFLPTTTQYPDRRPNSPQRGYRFDTSTTTIDDYDSRKPWTNPSTNTTVPSSTIIHHHHDGYIRPLTPPKSPRQVVDRNRSPSPTKEYFSTEQPITYRSSAVVYTKDKQSSVNGGEIRTWSARDNNHEGGTNQKAVYVPVDYTRAEQQQRIVSPTMTNDYSNHSRNSHQDDRYENIYQYERDRHQQYSNTINSDRSNNSTRPTILTEREKGYDQVPRSYKDTQYTQETSYAKTPGNKSDFTLRHCTLKRTNDYDGLGVLITADADTRLNHRIRDVEPESPGERVGLRKNDRIVGINGVNVENVEFNSVLMLIKQGLVKNDLQFSVINESVLI